MNNKAFTWIFPIEISIMVKRTNPSHWQLSQEDLTSLFVQCFGIELKRGSRKEAQI